MFLSIWVLAFSLSAHEYAHGYAALTQGDNTAQRAGRLTLNPLKHLDLFLSLLVPGALWLLGLPILGGAKPIPVERVNFRHGARSDILVSAAGILANLTIAGACWGLLQVLPSPVWQFGLTLNLVLAAFNALPIPPLDGSRVFSYAMPRAWRPRYQRAGAVGFLVLIGGMWLARALVSR